MYYLGEFLLFVGGICIGFGSGYWFGFKRGYIRGWGVRGLADEVTRAEINSGQWSK